MKKHLIFLCIVFFAALTLCAEPVRIKIVDGQQQYTFTPAQSGTYWVSAVSKSLIPVGKQHFAKLRLDNGLLLTRRLLAYNSVKSTASLERFPLAAGKQYTLFFQYDPKTTKVAELQFSMEKPYPVPKAAANYQPKLLPREPHPRVLVNAGYLAWLRKNLTVGENLSVWQDLEKVARKPYVFQVQPGQEITYDSALLGAVQAKAFCFLVTGNEKTGREAVELLSAYLKIVSFGNGQDVTRKVGETIFTAAFVYDWCYGLLSAQEKTFLHDRMLFFAAEMEAAWPPFRQNAAAGHGNEAQFSRDLLAMAIALYDEDPQPWKYVAYQMLENWMPLKRFTHASGRHSQGSSYGQYRSKFDFLAALQFKRTFGFDVFPKEIIMFPYYWYYLRLPDGCFLIEGDDNWKVTRPQYIPLNPQLLNCLLALYPNPEFKMELQRGKKRSKPLEPVLFLLTNDPALKAEDHRTELPLTRLYKAPLPGMAVRTGWNFTPDSNDLVLTMNGGNYQLRNHQHGDLGSFQLFYRDYLIQDLGQYNYYGVPYDRMLNKTAALHSMMRFYDPLQKCPSHLNHWLNVGGQNVEEDRPPLSLASLLKDKRYYCGETPHAGFGPSKQKPVYDFMETSLAPAYGDRLESYTRTFVFWNQNQNDRPGTLLILDRFLTKRPEIKPIFQLTTVRKTEWKNGVLSIRSEKGNKTGCVSVLPLIPKQVDVKILSGDASRTFQNVCVPARKPKQPEADGSRIEITGKGNTYLNVLQIHDGKLKALPVVCTCVENRIQVLISDPKSDYLTIFGETGKTNGKTFSINVCRNGTHVLLLDLVPGAWEAVNANKKLQLNVDKEECSIYCTLDSGIWKIQHLSGKGAK